MKLREIVTSWLIAENKIEPVKKEDSKLSEKAQWIKALIPSGFPGEEGRVLSRILSIIIDEKIELAPPLERTSGLFKLNWVVVPLGPYGGHNYPIGEPALCLSLANPGMYLLKINGELGNSLKESGASSDTIRRATKEEIVRFVNSLPEEVLNRHFGYVLQMAKHVKEISDKEEAENEKV